MAEKTNSLRYLCYSKQHHLKEALTRTNKILTDKGINIEITTTRPDLPNLIEFLANYTDILMDEPITPVYTKAKQNTTWKIWKRNT